MQSLIKPLRFTLTALCHDQPPDRKRLERKSNSASPIGANIDTHALLRLTEEANRFGVDLHKVGARNAREHERAPYARPKGQAGGADRNGEQPYTPNRQNAKDTERAFKRAGPEQHEDVRHADHTSYAVASGRHTSSKRDRNANESRGDETQADEKSSCAWRNAIGSDPSEDRHRSARDENECGQ